MEKELPSTITQPVSTDPVPTEVIVVPESNKEDPLDTLTEEELRAEAKKYRGIAARKERQGHTSVPTEVKNDTPFLTKDEFYATNRNKAIQSIEAIPDNDPLASVKQELDQHWDEIVKYYVPRNGQETPESILEDIYDAHLVWKRRVGSTSNDDSARNLQATVVTTPTGGRAETKTQVNEDPRFVKAKTPDQWYPKKN